MSPLRSLRLCEKTGYQTYNIGRFTHARTDSYSQINTELLQFKKYLANQLGHLRPFNGQVIH